jgi:hypothetical protein
MPPSDPSLFPPDEQNPYAPPRFDLKPEPAAAELAPVPVSIGDILSRTWEIYSENMLFCIGVVFSYLLILLGMASVASFAVRLARNEGQGVAALVGVMASLALVFFIAWITLGMMQVMLDIAREREPSLGGLVSGARFLGRAIIASVLCWLAIIAIGALGGALGGLLTVLVDAVFDPAPPVMVSLVVFEAFVCYVAIIVLSLRLSQFLYLIVDRDMAAIDSLRVSYRITRGHAGLLFALYLITGLINLGGMLACGIGLIFTTPYVVLLLVVAYLALAGEASPGAHAKGEPLPELEPL